MPFKTIWKYWLSVDIYLSISVKETGSAGFIHFIKSWALENAFNFSTTHIEFYLCRYVVNKAITSYQQCCIFGSCKYYLETADMCQMCQMFCVLSTI